MPALLDWHDGIVFWQFSAGSDSSKFYSSIMAKENISDANVENIVRFMLAGVSNMTAASSEYFINMTVFSLPCLPSFTCSKQLVFYHKWEKTTWVVSS